MQAGSHGSSFKMWCKGWGKVQAETTNRAYHSKTGFRNNPTEQLPFSTEESINVELPNDWKEFKPERQFELQEFHILNNNRDQLQRVWTEAGLSVPDDAALAAVFKRAVEQARNPKNNPMRMLPQIYPPQGIAGGNGWVRQLLMPIHLCGSPSADIALAIDIRSNQEKEGEFLYTSETVLTLGQANLNTRPVHWVESPWLRTGINEQRVETDQLDSVNSDRNSESGSSTCRAASEFNHSSAQAVGSSSELNSQGYPVRPVEQDCPYYKKHGQCDFRARCTYNHPADPPQPRPERTLAPPRKDCRSWLEGICKRGQACAFIHDPQKQGIKTRPVGAASHMVPAAVVAQSEVVVNPQDQGSFPSIGDSSLVGRATSDARAGGIENRPPSNSGHMNPSVGGVYGDRDGDRGGDRPREALGTQMVASWDDHETFLPHKCFSLFVPD